MAGIVISQIMRHQVLFTSSMSLARRPASRSSDKDYTTFRSARLTGASRQLSAGCIPDIHPPVASLDDAAKTPDTGAQDAGNRAARQAGPGACEAVTHRYDRSQRGIKYPPNQGEDYEREPGHAPGAANQPGGCRDRRRTP